ncbi:hypothetical protein GCM10009657_14040 [Oryzihumus leptocrescens]
MGELLGGHPRAALEHDDVGAAGREVVGRDGTPEAAADDDDVTPLDGHAGLPLAVVAGWQSASCRA